MNKTLIILLILFTGLLAAYAGNISIDYIEQPTTCTNCHKATPFNYTAIKNNLTLIHENKNINCITCHSQEGVNNYLATRKLITSLVISEKLTPTLNSIFLTNTSFNDTFAAKDFNLLKANCTKCHDPEKTTTPLFNHEAATNCESCHTFHKPSPETNTTPTWERMYEGAHRVFACIDCHETNATRPTLPQCTACHTPHTQKGVNWNNSICLSCHTDQHIPQKNGTYTKPVPKQLCAVCHQTIYQTLTAYDTRHNQKLVCSQCHTQHRKKPNCIDCHTPHIHIDSRACSSCHSYVSSCNDCHSDAHAPYSGLPRITDTEQLKAYAIKTGQKQE